MKLVIGHKKIAVMEKGGYTVKTKDVLQSSCSHAKDLTSEEHDFSVTGDNTTQAMIQVIDDKE